MQKSPKMGANPSKGMKAALVQFCPLRGQKEQNLSRMEHLLETAGQQGADLVLFPEMASTGYLFDHPDQIRPLAEDAMGESFLRLSGLCARYGMMAAYGFAELWRGDLYNSMNLIDQKGQLLASYQKTHLFEADWTWAKPGVRGYLQINSNWGRIGLGICMDLNFDAFVEHHRQMQTQILLIATNWLEEGLPVASYWQRRLQDFKGVCLLANRTGSEDGVWFCGTSACLIPGQKPQTASRQEEQILWVDLALASPPMGIRAVCDN